MADEQQGIPDCPKCEECVPGLPGWMATFSDMVTLLLTFFVLLLSFAKTETAKYEAALGSLRNAYGGNVLQHGEVVQRGKSADNQPTMVESQEPIKPFPIEFLTMEGILNKHEINRESTETLNVMKSDLGNYDLQDLVTVSETKEGIKVDMKDKIYFKKGSAEISKINVESFKKMINLLRGRDWTVFVQGHSSAGERGKDNADPYTLSSYRAAAVTRSLIENGIRPNKITTVFYGDTRPARVTSGDVQSMSRRVEFIIRKTDLKTEGREVETR